MTKIIFFDIDGTLRDEAEGIPKSVKTAFSQCRKNGCKLVICTGRSIGTIQEDVMELGADGYITGGGCRIQYGTSILKDEAFSSDLVGKLLEQFRQEKDKGITMESENLVFMNARAASLLISRNQKLGKDEQSEKITYKENLNSLRVKDHRIHKICFWTYEDDGKLLKEQLEVKAQLAQSGRWGEFMYYGLIPKSCGKGNAVQTLCSHLEIPMEDTMSFGDGKNDIDMLKVTGISAAMENGDRELFPYADLICREPMKDGIYEALIETGVITGFIE